MGDEYQLETRRDRRNLGGIVASGDLYSSQRICWCAFLVIAVLAMFGSMCLGGLWVARMIESRFILHGVLVGIVAGVVFYALFFSFRSIVWPNEPPSPIANDVFAAALKILGAAVGAYVGGIRRKKLLSAQTAKLPS